LFSVFELQCGPGSHLVGGHHLDLHLVGVAAARLFHCRDLDVGPGRGDGVDVAVHALDLDPLAGGQPSGPAKLLSRGGRCGPEGQGD